MPGTVSPSAPTAPFSSPTTAAPTWVERPISEDDFHLNQIAAAAADGTLYMAAEAGHLYRSADQGATSQPLPAPYEGSFFGFLPLSDGALLVFGLRGELFRSEDRGETWTTIASSTGGDADSNTNVRSYKKKKNDGAEKKKKSK